LDRICLIGDSITHGTGDDSLLGWPGIIFQNHPKLTIYNLGIRADTSELIEHRWYREAKARLPAQQKCGLIFSFGTNDSALEMGKGVRVDIEKSLICAMKILSIAKEWMPTLWIGPIPIIEDMQPFNSGAGLYQFNNSRISSYSKAYQELATSINIPYLDIFTPLSTNHLWRDSQRSNDGIHPKHLGYQELARIVDSWQPFQKLLT
jgi:lysophospholipase L1-like esterase